MTVLSRDVFLKQDSTTTNAIIQYYDRMSSSSSPSSSSHSPSMWRVRHPSSPSLQKLSPEERMEQSNTFQRLAFYESEATLSRDDEDAIKLQRGIDLAVSKHVLPSLGDATSAMNTTSSDDDNYNASDEDDSNMVNQQQYINIDVMGKTPDEVAMELWKRVSSTAAKSTNVVRRKVDSNTTPGGTGQVIVLVGLSGTGKVSLFLGYPVRFASYPTRST